MLSVTELPRTYRLVATTAARDSFLARAESLGADLRPVSGSFYLNDADLGDRADLWIDSGQRFAVTLCAVRETPESFAHTLRAELWALDSGTLQLTLSAPNHAEGIDRLGRALAALLPVWGS
jgi:KaiC/GvpD/RAD55 family RecA-like ATPase